MSTGFQKPISKREFKKVLLGRITGAGDTVQCICGWGFRHDREKVREDAIDRHLDKYHKGRGIRL